MDASIRSNLLINRLEQLISIGIALSAEKQTPRLMEKILLGAKELTYADGGTLYTVDEERCLHFAIIHTDSLKIAMGGTTRTPINFDPIPLFHSDGTPNDHMVVVKAVLEGRTFNIPDAYLDDNFDFSGTRAFDRKTGYHSTSFLAVPLKDHEDEIIGVLQLINAMNPDTGKIVPFSADDQQMVEALASQAAIAMTNKTLLDEQKKLFESFIQLIASAIDDKSPYTGGHCRRVPELSLMLAEAVHKTTQGPLKGFSMTDNDRYELRIASWLHDCGKVVTPVHVVDKGVKLETICDRIESVGHRFEILRRDAKIKALQAELSALRSGQDTELKNNELTRALQLLDEERAFLEKVNIGGEFMKLEDQERVREIALKGYQDAQGKYVALLSEDEINNLNIPKGTLTDEEREIINHHIVATIKMLESLPMPRHLKRVPEYAGGHHERMDGKGYPKGLTRDQMSIQARIIGVADIFEALTARDRPYKKGKSLAESLRIMGYMKNENHIDPDLFDIFVSEKVYMDYADKFLDPEQIDEV